MYTSKEPQSQVSTNVTPNKMDTGSDVSMGYVTLTQPTDDNNGWIQVQEGSRNSFKPSSTQTQKEKVASPNKFEAMTTGDDENGQNDDFIRDVDLSQRGGNNSTNGLTPPVRNVAARDNTTYDTKMAEEIDSPPPTFLNDNNFFNNEHDDFTIESVQNFEGNFSIQFPVNYPNEPVDHAHGFKKYLSFLLYHEPTITLYGNRTNGTLEPITSDLSLPATEEILSQYLDGHFINHHGNLQAIIWLSFYANLKSFFRKIYKPLRQEGYWCQM